ncbi:MAG: hypothetical protein LBP53_08380 [Candidatus Peribacteria bacterium]|jgi:hypothetical protein|nr:hypothetical protein [Candidatus Peribacteria bacterium]
MMNTVPPTSVPTVQLVPENTVSEVPVQPVPENAPAVSAQTVSVQPTASQEKGFLDTMIDKGASTIASMTGQPDPFTGQGGTPSATLSATEAQPAPSASGFFGKLR